MQTPPIFRPFKSDYVWSPYEGEVYQPTRCISGLDRTDASLIGCIVKLISRILRCCTIGYWRSPPTPRSPPKITIAPFPRLHFRKKYSKSPKIGGFRGPVQDLQLSTPPSLDSHRNSAAPDRTPNSPRSRPQACDRPL